MLLFFDLSNQGLGKAITQSQPRLAFVLKAFDFAACGGVIWSGVLLSDPLFHEFGLESVAGGSPAVSEAGGEHRPVSVKVENGVPCLAIAVRKVATTAGPVTGRCAVTDNA